MFSRPADAPSPLTRLTDGEAGQTFSQVWSYERTRGGSLRAWLGRISGRADRRLLSAQAAITLELVQRIDELAQRLQAHEEVAEEVSSSLSVDLTQLRAEVERLRSQAESLLPPSP